MPSWIPIGTMARMKTMTFLRTRSIRRREKLALAQNLSTKETVVPHILSFYIILSMPEMVSPSFTFSLPEYEERLRGHKVGEEQVRDGVEFVTRADEDK